jgi:hypothetical protein
MKISFFAALLSVLLFGNLALAGEGTQEERTKITDAVGNKNVPLAISILGKTRDFRTWAQALDAMSKLKDGNTSRSLLKCALTNSRLWDDPGIEPGEIAIARRETRSRTVKALAAVGIAISYEDLSDKSKRIKIAANL